MESMVYICPTDWRWIKQRPQFLAEQLSEYYEMHVIYPYRNQRGGLQKKAESHVEPRAYFTLPSLGGRFSAIERINRSAARFQIGRMIQRVKPDYLWLTMPWQIELIPPGYPILYDCMDDYVAIEMRQDNCARTMEQEAETVRRAAHVFASSENLRSLLAKRYGRDGVHLLRNGYSADWPDRRKEKKRSDGRFRLGYFGTIGRWFDFELLLESLAVDERIEYHLFGPLEKGITVPANGRIVEHGVIEHDEIMERAADMDALIMPFVLTDVVRSVDPVKLYEYIYLNKNILCIRYPEVERFNPFVIFYETKEEYMQSLRSMMTGNPLKYTQKQATEFLEQNNWEKRARQVYEIIKTQNGRDMR